MFHSTHALHHKARHHDLVTGLWRLADPKIMIASAVPFLAGLALAWDAAGSVNVSLAITAFLAIFFVEVGKNAVNDLADYRSGADLAVLESERTPFSGGKRVLVDELLTESEVIGIGWVAFAMAGVAGLIVALHSRVELLLLGAAAAGLAYAYSAHPFALSYRGLGEAAVLLVYGPGIVIGTVLLLGGSITVEVIMAGTSFGFLIANVLLVNELPDERADRLAGKRTLVVRLGGEGAASLIDSMFVTAFAIPLIAAFYADVPFRIVAIAAGMPLAVVASDLLGRPKHQPPVASQALTLAAYTVSGLAYAAAVVL
jgi:1,4-dihydroxy-2-naphthoate octaprenyltransferase